MATLMAAGLPLLQYDNDGAIVATQTLVRELDIGIFCRDMEQLGAQLRSTGRLEQIQENAKRHRLLFTFDNHADELLAFFHRVIAERGSRSTSVGAHRSGSLGRASNA